MINYDTSRGGITVETDPGPKTQSRLTIRDAHDTDSGNYTCSASNTEPASIYVFVSEGRLRLKSTALRTKLWYEERLSWSICNIHPTRCNVTQFIFLETALHISDGTPPIIRSAHKCIYSIWYLSHRYCYLLLSWKNWNWFECAVLCCRWRTPQNNQKNLAGRRHCFEFFRARRWSVPVLHAQSFFFRVKMMNPWLIPSNNIQKKLISLFAIALQKFFTNFNMFSFLFRRRHAWHPSRTDFCVAR